MKRSPLKRSQKPLKRTVLKKENTKSAKQKHEDRGIQKIKDIVFYEQMWISSKHKSDLTGNWLGENLLSIFFHHLLPKEPFPQFRYKKWNILVCEPHYHHQIETNPYMLPEELYDKYQQALSYAKQKANLI